MALPRASIATCLASVLLLAAPFAEASDAWNDVVPGIGATIPSPRAEEVAPLHRLYRPRRMTQAEPETARPAPAKTAKAPADATEGASGPVAAHDRVDAAKPAVPAADASVGGAVVPGEAKSDERIDPAGTSERTTPDVAAPKDVPAIGTATATDTVRVPAPIMTAARRALPGIAFAAVDLSRSGASTVYGLSGTSDAGRAVSVAIDQSGKVLKVDRQARDTEVPDEVMALAEAVLPGARIETAMLSLRPAFLAFYTFTGEAASGQPFVLDIRSDARSLSFVDPE